MVVAKLCIMVSLLVCGGCSGTASNLMSTESPSANSRFLGTAPPDIIRRLLQGANECAFTPAFARPFVATDLTPLPDGFRPHWQALDAGDDPVLRLRALECYLRAEREIRG